MTELEEKIYEQALEAMPVALKEARRFKGERDFVLIPFLVDGVIDSLVYDKNLDRFIKIEYCVGKNVGRAIVESETGAAFFDEVEYRTFQIPK